jgi:hypothetical protein
VASGVAIIGAVFYSRLGSVSPGVFGHGNSVSAMEVAMVIDAVAVLAAAGLTLLLPRRARRPQAIAAHEPATEVTAGAAH